MSKRFLTAVILTAAFVLCAQIIQKGSSENPRFFLGDTQMFAEEINGNVKAYWDSVAVRGNYNYSKGLMDGLQKEYFQDGRVSAEWEMKKGVRVGKGTEYHQDGSVSFKRELDSKGNGIGTEFYKNGMKMRERLYKEGNQVHVSRYNNDIKGKRYKRTADELFIEAQEMAGIGMFGHAIKSYEELIEKHPGHERVPDVKFLIAFTYHNSLQEEELAKKHYEEFLEKYPESPLAVSARFEMETIGKNVDALDLFKTGE